MSMKPKSEKQQELLDSLKDVLQKQPFYSSGVMALPPDSFTLFYRDPVTHDARCIDLATATEEQLVHLSDVCAPATFGRNNEDVFDESYRNARKLDCKDFACHFDAERTGLARAAYSQILAGEDGDIPVRVELYKLNVYGPGSFFKAHQDTPRGEDMFGSLVVSFPTAHEGGALALRATNQDNDEGEAVLDCGAWLRDASEPSVAYVAFFSDVMHEVYKVEKGYRITLTYNLYFDEQAKDYPDSIPKNLINLPAKRDEESASRVFAELLDDPSFLAEGGTLGFGLRYQYAIDRKPVRYGLNGLLSCLKGSDAVIRRLLTSNGLKPRLVVIYDANGAKVMTSMFVDHLGLIDENYCDLAEVLDGTIIDADDEYYMDKIQKYVWWIVPQAEGINGRTTKYAAYGNEASLGSVYGALSMVASVGPPGARACS